MGLLRSLSMLGLFLWCIVSPGIRSQSDHASAGSSSARPLDALLQDYAYRAFVRPRTGVAYDGAVPSNLTGIEVAAIRLKSGSLFRRGLPSYKEFEIPVGVLEQPYVERLVFVYQNLGNWSMTFYPLSGYTYLAPVLGLLAYDAYNLSATNLPELDIRAFGAPILIRFSDVRPAPGGLVARCVRFDLNGLVSFSNVSSGNVCSTIQQGHFSIVVESVAPAPAPVPSGPPAGGAPFFPGRRGGNGNNNRKTGIIIGSVLGGVALLVLLTVLVLWLRKYKQRKKMHHMEKASEAGEPLRMRPVGNTRAPAATVTRTQPMLENEYVP